MEGRDERVGDQLLRMDYVKERRSWEEEMRRRAEVVDEMDVEGDVEEIAVEMDVEGVSPTEEKEIEDLISYLNESEDDGYDEAFLEMLGNEDVDMT